MIDYYGDFYRDEYRKNIHHTISDFEYGGLSLDQGFELQAILPDFITYLYTKMANTYEMDEVLDITPETNLPNTL